MEVIRQLDHFPEYLQGGVLAIGKFDGMHRGHTLILSRLREHARQSGVPSIALTFEPMPVHIIRPELGILPLSTLEQKIGLMAAQGVDALIVCPTDPQFLAQTADDFFANTIQKTLRSKVIVEGRNFFFGHHREGTPEKLQRLCHNAGITLEIVKTIAHNGEQVSSSRIRTLLQSGNIAVANDLLSRPYRLTGKVTVGEQRGRTLGFPTANLAGVETVLPKTGLYAATVEIAADDSVTGDSVADDIPAAVHVGTNPTFGETPFKIEAHLLDFSGDLYGRTLHIDFLARLRDVVHYPTVNELLKQMRLDVIETRRIVESFC
ncbi:MAG: bifunctional riboflavin kinase/FAD synthetase [Planctomycetaceae bacterium]|nr:bifunctional riboflavin kinase/FAD synthetase [Planctomycetaceae bacterium]